MKLELKHLAPYLPYRLKILDEKSEPSDNVFTLESVNIYESVSDTEGNIDIPFIEIKPILRPLSDIYSQQLLLKHFFNKEKKGVLKEIQMISELKYDPMECSYKVIEMLFSEHFDVFGLIEQGLAISIHDVGQADA
jgi:hypothetical protein